MSLDIFCTCVSLGLHVWVQFEVYGAATWLNRVIQPEQHFVPYEALHTDSSLTGLERIDHAGWYLKAPALPELRELDLSLRAKAGVRRARVPFCRHCYSTPQTRLLPPCQITCSSRI